MPRQKASSLKPSPSSPPRDAGATPGPPISSTGLWIEPESQDRLQRAVLECLSAGDGLTPEEIRKAIARRLAPSNATPLRAVDVRIAAQGLYDAGKIDVETIKVGQAAGQPMKLLTTTRLYRRLFSGPKPWDETPGPRSGPTGPGAAA